MAPRFLLLLTSCLQFLLLASCAPGEDSRLAVPDAGGPAARDLYLDHGWSSLDAGREQEAVRYFELALRDEPGHPGALLGLGETRLRQGRLEEAKDAFEAILETAPKSERAQALQGIGIAMLRSGQIDAAEPRLQTAIGLDRNLWRAWNALGRLRDSRRDWAGALVAYRRAISLRPEDAVLHSNLGFSLVMKGDFANAETVLNRALTLEPDLAIARANLRLALAMAGDYERALAGASEDERANALNNIGYAALLRGDHERARALFLQAMEESPTFFEPARRNLAFLDGLASARRAR